MKIVYVLGHNADLEKSFQLSYKFMASIRAHAKQLPAPLIVELVNQHRISLPSIV